MKYVFQQERHDTVDFRVSRYEYVLPTVLQVLGILGLIFGLYGLITGILWSGIGTFDYLMASVGGLFLSVGRLLSKQQRWEPRCIRFDNASAQLLISQDQNFLNTVSIPYQDLKEFDQRKTNNSTVSGPTSQAAYEVVLLTKDFQVWVLGEFSTEHKAAQHLSFLKGKVNLSMEGVREVPATPKSLTVLKSASSTLLKWRNADDTTALIGLIILISIYGIGTVIFDLGGFPVFVYDIFLTVFSLAIIAFVFNYLKKRNRLTCLEISTDKLKFRSEHKSGSIPIRELDLNQIRAIGTHFSGQESAKGLLIADEETMQLMDDVQNRRLSLRDMVGAFQKLRKAFQIDVSGLSGVDAIRLSIMIRTLVQARIGNSEKGD